MLFTHQCVSLFLMGTSTIYQSLRGHVVSLFTPTRAEHDFRYGPFQGPFYTYVPPYDCAALLVVFTSPPKAALFSPHSALRYSRQSRHSIPYYVTPPTRYTLFIFQSASRWRPATNSTLLTSTNIAQHYIPLYTAAPTFPILFSKIPLFKNFLGPFPGPIAPPFRIPILTLHILGFFPTFRPLFSLPSSG